MCMYCEDEEFEELEVAPKKPVAGYIWVVERDGVALFVDRDGEEEAIKFADGLDNVEIRRYEDEPFWIDANAEIPEGMHLVTL
ncbi:hypothetical protein [Nocardia tengchongensis]|uniref:hypothetical protein n=1 Tax=Nocardia tengchongensis TaxID=2055889 RepID=UPI003649DD9C